MKSLELQTHAPVWILWTSTYSEKSSRLPFVCKHLIFFKLKTTDNCSIRLRFNLLLSTVLSQVAFSYWPSIFRVNWVMPLKPKKYPGHVGGKSDGSLYKFWKHRVAEKKRRVPLTINSWSSIYCRKSLKLLMGDSLRMIVISIRRSILHAYCRFATLQKNHRAFKCATFADTSFINIFWCVCMIQPYYIFDIHGYS